MSETKEIECIICHELSVPDWADEHGKERNICRWCEEEEDINNKNNDYDQNN